MKIIPTFSTIFQDLEGYVWKYAPEDAPLIVLHSYDAHCNDTIHIGYLDSHGKFNPLDLPQNRDTNWPSSSWMHGLLNSDGSIDIHPRTALFISDNFYNSLFKNPIIARGTTKEPRSSFLSLQLKPRSSSIKSPSLLWYLFGGMWSISPREADFATCHHSHLKQYYCRSRDESYQDTLAAVKSHFRQALLCGDSPDPPFRKSGMIYRQGEIVSVRFAPDRTPVPCVVLSTDNFHSKDIAILLGTMRYTNYMDDCPWYIPLPSAFVPGHKRLAISLTRISGVTHLRKCKHHIIRFSPPLNVKDIIDDFTGKIFSLLEELHGD